MTINANRKIISLTGPNCSFANINACRADVVAEGGYTPTVIVTNQTELNTELAKSAAQLEGQVIGVQYNATPYVISRTQLRKNYGTGGLVITQYGATMPVFSGISPENCTNLTLHSLAVNGTILLYTGSSTITVDGCVIYGTYYDPTVPIAYNVYSNSDGISVVSNGGSTITNVSITDCLIYNCRYGIKANAYTVGAWSIVGNEIYNCYYDHIQVGNSSLSSLEINWNVLYGTVPFAPVNPALDPHADFIQLLGAGSDWPVTINGNIMFAGTATGDQQAIFLDDMAPGAFYVATIKGNLVANRGYRGISVSSAKNCTIIGNTVGVGDMSDAIALGTSAWINLSELEEGGGNVLKNNVSYTSTDGTATPTNYHLYSALSTAAFTALFDGVAFEASDLDTRSKVLAAYSMKVGGALDQTVNIGAVGSGYVDFEARTLNGTME